MIDLNKQELANESQKKHIETLLNTMAGYDFESKFGLESVVEEVKSTISMKYRIEFRRISDLTMQCDLFIAYILPSGMLYQRKTGPIGEVTFEADFSNSDAVFKTLEGYANNFVHANYDGGPEVNALIDANKNAFATIARSFKRKMKTIETNAERAKINSIEHVKSEIFSQLNADIRKRMLTEPRILAAIEGVGTLRGISVEVNELKSNNHSPNANYKQYITIDIEPLRWENDRGEFLKISQLQFYARIEAADVDGIAKLLKERPDVTGQIAQVSYTIEFKGSNMRTSAQNEKDLFEFVKGFRGALDSMAHLRNLKNFKSGMIEQVNIS